MSPEAKLRRQLRARAWDLAALAPEDLAVPVEEEVILEDGCRAVVRLEPAGWRPTPPEAASGGPVRSLEPQQRYLPGLGLTELEQAVIRGFVASGNVRRTMPQLRDDVETQLARHVGEHALKVTLARMADPLVAILDNTLSEVPPGYHLTEAYRSHLARLANQSGGGDTSPAGFWADPGGAA